MSQPNKNARCLWQLTVTPADLLLEVWGIRVGLSAAVVIPLCNALPVAGGQTTWRAAHHVQQSRREAQKHLVEGGPVKITVQERAEPRGLGVKGGREAGKSPESTQDDKTTVRLTCANQQVGQLSCGEYGGAAAPPADSRLGSVKKSIHRRSSVKGAPSAACPAGGCTTTCCCRGAAPCCMGGGASQGAASPCPPTPKPAAGSSVVVATLAGIPAPVRLTLEMELATTL